MVDAQLFSSCLLRSEEGDETFKDGIHAAAPYVNTHTLEYGHTFLQEYGSALNNPAMEYKDRVKAARKHARLTQVELAKLVGIDQASISDLERGRSSRSSYNASIAKACGVSALWLENGKGEMLEARHEQSNVAPVAQPEQFFRYPIISWVAAGAWAEAVEPFPPGFADRYELSEYDAKGPAFWLEVKGDSMTASVGQSIAEGTLILVDTEADAQHGKLVIAKLADSNEATFKKLVEDGGRRYLKPLNPAYPTEMCAGDCRIVGVVVRALMKL
uniref:LexA family protein n=1 Tax=Pseudomonas alabamensis TaxID=3064349 RepID=UPI002953919F|nr:LexA family transcriptional regulator [Pseudomonas entomophila]